MTPRIGHSRSSADDRLWARPHRTTVAAVFGLVTCIAFESYAIVTALPAIAAELRSDNWYSLAFAATVATGIVGMIIGGNWADRRGPAIPLAAGGMLFLLGLAICAVAPGMGVFIIGRLLQGIGGGIDSVIVYVLIARLLPSPLLARIFGLLAGAWLLPALLGPVATGALVDLLHWRAVFGIVMIGAAGALYSLLRVARRIPPVHTTVRVFGRRGRWAMLTSLSIVGLHLAGQLPLAWMIAATLTAIAMTVICASRIMPPGTLRARPGPPRFIAVKGLLGAAATTTDVYLAHFLQRELGYAPTFAGGLVAIGALGWFAGAWLQGRATSPSQRGLAFASALVVAGPLAVLALVVGVVPVPIAVLGCIAWVSGWGSPTLASPP